MFAGGFVEKRGRDISRREAGLCTMRAISTHSLKWENQSPKGFNECSEYFQSLIVRIFRPIWKRL
jgi:hypothetical protein